MHLVELRTVGELNIRHNNVPVQFLTYDARVLFTFLALNSDSEFTPQVLAEQIFPSNESSLARLCEAQENLWEAFPLSIRLFRGLSVQEAIELGATIRLSPQPPVISLAVDALDLVEALDSGWAELERPEAAALLTEAAVAIGKGMAPGVEGAWMDDWREHLCGLYRDATVRFMVADPALCLQIRAERLFSGGTPKKTAPTATPFFGRTDELKSLRELLLEGERVISLVGLGGAGKTRLALELLSSLPGELQYWPKATVSLSGVSNRGGLLEALRKGLGQQMGDVLQDGRDPLGAICRTLQESTILFLDNAEDVVRNSPDGEVVQTLSYLVYRCPQIKLISTSRCRIGLPDEYVFPVEGLALPTDEELGTLKPEKLKEAYPGLEMLHNSLSSVKNSSLLPDNMGSVLALLRQSGGLPLSIELLANRISNHKGSLPSVEEIKRSAGSPRSAIDWALEPLSAATRSFLQRLSIFEGVFTVEAAEAVTGDSEVEFRLTELDDAGLITVQHLSQPIYKMPSAVRGFLSEQLESSPKYSELLKRHTTYFVDLASEGQIGLRGAERVIWLSRLRQASPDIVSVIHRNLRIDKQVEFASLLFSKFAQYFSADSRTLEGISLAKQVIKRIQDIGGVDTRIDVEVVDALGRLQTNAGLYADAEINLKIVYPFWRKVNDVRAIARCANNLAVCSDQQGRFNDAKTYYDVAWRGFYELNERRACAQIMQNMTFVLKANGLWEEANDLLEEACRIVTTEFPRESLTAKFLFDYAEVLYSLGDYKHAMNTIKDVLDILDIKKDVLRVANIAILAGLTAKKSSAYSSMDSDFYILCGWSIARSVTDKPLFVEEIMTQIDSHIRDMRLKEAPVFSEGDLEFIRKQILTL